MIAAVFVIFMLWLSWHMAHGADITKGEFWRGRLHALVGNPFKSLLVGTENPTIRGPRPEGIPGLLIDEIDLLGIWRTPRGYVAQVKASNKSYLLREGDQLFDGDVVNIHKDEVVFKQQVQDPTALKPFREVVKNLNPS